MLTAHCSVQIVQSLFQLFRILLLVWQRERFSSFLLGLLLLTYLPLPEVNEPAKIVPSQNTALIELSTFLNYVHYFQKIRGLATSLTFLQQTPLQVGLHYFLIVLFLLNLLPFFLFSDI